MTERRIVIAVEAAAPAKPPMGTACNGCGLCCLAEPCPLGMLVSRRRHGACAALRWDATRARYRCGLVSAPAQVFGWREGRVSGIATWLVARAAARWISAGEGCDAALVAAPADE